MNAITIVMAAFSIVAAIDRMTGNHLGLGKEFDRGFLLYGNLALAIVGMIVISPFLAQLLTPVSDFIANVLGLDPSILPASLFALDMGGAPLAVQVAKDARMGGFNGLVVASMMGCTISFTVPYSLGVVVKERREELLMGLLCGVVTIPVGCLAGGVVLGLPWGALLMNLIPLVVIAGVITAGLLLWPDGCVKAFGVLGRCIQIIITLGLALAVLRFLTGIEILPGLATLEEGAEICLSICAVLTGAFPMMHVIAKALKKPMEKLAQKAGVNDTSVTGLLSTLVSSFPTYEMMKDMDRKGAMFNAAFSVSAAFVFADHMAYAMAFDDTFLTSLIVGKLTAGVLALAVAYFVWNRIGNKGEKA